MSRDVFEMSWDIYKNVLRHFQKRLPRHFGNVSRRLKMSQDILKNVLRRFKMS